MLKNEDHAHDLFEQVIENKIVGVLKERVSVEEKRISQNEFNKLFDKEEDKAVETPEDK
jgi:hypothetical protein